MKGSGALANFKLYGVALCLVLVVALVVSLLGLAVPSGPSIADAAPPPPRAVPNTDVNPYGADFFLEWEPEVWKIEKSLQMARDAGIGWVKQQFPWEDLQLKPGPDGYWNPQLSMSTWDKYDRIVDLARQHGLNIIARLDRPPRWAQAAGSPPESPPLRYEDYGDFVYAVVKHYSGKIFYYQIWNEPNIYPEWGDQAPDPAAYVQLLQIAYKRAKEADPNVLILSAPLAQTLENSSRNMSDVSFLQGMYENGAKDYFDILFANAYGFAFPPDDPPDPQRLNFARVVFLRRVMERNGDEHKAVWFNEFGWNAAPEDFPPGKLPWARVSEQLQADYTVQAIRKARAEWPWAGVFCIWYFRQSGHISPDQPDYYFRMVDTGFTPRPLYTAVKDVAGQPAVAASGTYEETNPAAVFGQGWQPRLLTEASGGAAQVAQHAGDSVTVTFSGSDISIRAERGPRAGLLYVTLDGRETNLLPRDREGRSYLDLYSSASSGIVWIPVASGLGGDKNVLRMTIAQTANPRSSATEVVIDGFAVQGNGVSRWGLPVPLLAGALVVVSALLVWRWRRR